ncbi:hypothetical protein L218DRAFT_942112 [Marasmius fiardii PR-910]|nr:hypothetical protein L218DRAFT_942112 [Marasmius fiardii PR-910]
MTFNGEITKGGEGPGACGRRVGVTLEAMVLGVALGGRKEETGSKVYIANEKSGDDVAQKAKSGLDNCVRDEKRLSQSRMEVQGELGMPMKRNVSGWVLPCWMLLAIVDSTSQTTYRYQTDGNEPDYRELFVPVVLQMVFLEELDA